jgi:hypothetical protein
MASEEYPAQRQNSDRLPERKLSPAKEQRQQPVPQMHHDFAADEDKERYSRNRRRSYPQQSLFAAHVRFLMISKIMAW